MSYHRVIQQRDTVEWISTFTGEARKAEGSEVSANRSLCQAVGSRGWCCVAPAGGRTRPLHCTPPGPVTGCRPPLCEADPQGAPQWVPGPSQPPPATRMKACPKGDLSAHLENEFPGELACKSPSQFPRGLAPSP